MIKYVAPCRLMPSFKRHRKRPLLSRVKVFWAQVVHLSPTSPKHFVTAPGPWRARKARGCREDTQRCPKLERAAISIAFQLRRATRVKIVEMLHSWDCRGGIDLKSFCNKQQFSTDVEVNRGWEHRPRSDTWRLGLQAPMLSSQEQYSPSTDLVYWECPKRVYRESKCFDSYLFDSYHSTLLFGPQCREPIWVPKCGMTGHLVISLTSANTVWESLPRERERGGLAYIHTWQVSPSVAHAVGQSLAAGGTGTKI